MKEIFEKIWTDVLPYLDTRNNEIHIKISTMYAFRLLAMEGGDEDVVIPAIILHDAGWKTIPVEQQHMAYGPKIESPVLVKKHEMESVQIAEGILEKINYDSVKTQKILKIIDGHDSRVEAFSLNDRIVKDADKLWRFSKEGWAIDCKRFHMNPEERSRTKDMDIDMVLFLESSKKMAREEIKNRL